MTDRQIRAKIVRIRAKIAELKIEQHRLERLIKEKPTGEPRTGMDSEYFRSEDLAVYMDRYINDHDETVNVLCQRAKISTRTFRRIRSGEYEFTAFTTADRLFTAMNIPKVLDTFHRYKLDGFGSPFKTRIRVPEPPPTIYVED